MSAAAWLVKQEPSDFPWSKFAREGRSPWTGVRNYQARNHLRTMSPGDWVLYYHSGAERAVVGLASVIRSAYPDPTATEGDWSAVDLRAICPLHTPVTLATIKQDPTLKDMPIVRLSRLSVSPVSNAQFHRLLTLAHTPLPQP